MNFKHNTLRIVPAVLFAFVGTSAFAQTTFTSDSPFVAVNSAAAAKSAATTAADPEVFGYVPADPDMNFAYSPYAGTQVTLASAGPQAKVTSVTLYAYALKTGVYQHIGARFRFWNAYQASASPVFSGPVEFVVDLTACPCNFDAGKTYSVDVVLPKPVYTESVNVGFSQVWETDTGDSVVAVSNDLVPAFDTSGSGAATTGAAAGAYANFGRSPDDLNFVPADAAANPATKLGLGLYGTSMTLDQCTGAANFQDQFDEEFDDAGAFYQRWKANPNNGTFTVGSGYLALSAPDGAAQFPYIASGPQSTMIPPSGDFEVIWLAQYDTGPKPNGDGEMVISQGAPLNGNAGDAYVGNVLRAWQDTGFYVYATTSGGTSQVGNGNGTSLNLMQYCWVNGKVEFWQNGQQRLAPTTQPARRPDSLWFGNPTISGGPTSWAAATIYRVLVRGNQAGIVDHIFSDGFGPAPDFQ